MKGGEEHCPCLTILQGPSFGVDPKYFKADGADTGASAGLVAVVLSLGTSGTDTALTDHVKCYREPAVQVLGEGEGGAIGDRAGRGTAPGEG